MEHKTQAAVAANVRGLLGKRRITIRKIAGDLGLNETAFRRRLACRVDLTVDELTDLADTLDVDVLDLLEGRPSARTAAGR